MELGADWLPGGRGGTGGGIVVPVSGGAAGADHLCHGTGLLNMVTGQHPEQDDNIMLTACLNKRSSC